MYIPLAVWVDHVDPCFGIFRELFFKCIQKFVVVREGVKILEIFVRSFAREDSCKVFCLRSLFCPLYQDPHITWCQVFKNLIQVELPVEICSLEALLFSQTLSVQSRAVKLWAVTNLKLTWKRYLLVESNNTSPYLTHLECWACCKRRSSSPGWRGCPRGCGSHDLEHLVNLEDSE